MPERETAHKWVTAVFESYKAELANKREEQTAADIVQRVINVAVSSSRRARSLCRVWRPLFFSFRGCPYRRSWYTQVCDMYEPKFDDPKFGAEAQYAVAMLRLVLVWRMFVDRACAQLVHAEASCAAFLLPSQGYRVGCKCNHATI